MEIFIVFGVVFAAAILIAVLIPQSPSSGLTNVGNKRSDAAVARFTRDEMNTAALRLLRGRVPHCSKSWIGGTIEQCARAELAINALRKEYANYQPSAMRRQIMEWLDYYEYEAQEAREDIQSQKSKRELDAYSRQNRVHDDRVADLMQILSTTE